MSSFLAYEKIIVLLGIVCKFLMTILDERSSTENTFYVNKETLDKNSRENSLISQRLIYDYFPTKEIELHKCISPPVAKGKLHTRQ